jgi:hypothetical protein
MVAHLAKARLPGSIGRQIAIEPASGSVDSSAGRRELAHIQRRLDATRFGGTEVTLNLLGHARSMTCSTDGRYMGARFVTSSWLTRQWQRTLVGLRATLVWMLS